MVSWDAGKRCRRILSPCSKPRSDRTFVHYSMSMVNVRSPLSKPGQIPESRIPSVSLKPIENGFIKCQT